MGQRAHTYMQVLYIFNIYSSTHRFCLEWSAADIQRYVMPCGRGGSFIKEVNTLVAKVNMIGNYWAGVICLKTGTKLTSCFSLPMGQPLKPCPSGPAHVVGHDITMFACVCLCACVCVCVLCCAPGSWWYMQWTETTSSWYDCTTAKTPEPSGTDRVLEVLQTGEIARTEPQQMQTHL